MSNKASKRSVEACGSQQCPPPGKRQQQGTSQTPRDDGNHGGDTPSESQQQAARRGTQTNPQHHHQAPSGTGDRQRGAQQPQDGGSGEQSEDDESEEEEVETACINVLRVNCYGSDFDAGMQPLFIAHVGEVVEVEMRRQGGKWLDPQLPRPTVVARCDAAGQELVVAGVVQTVLPLPDDGQPGTLYRLAVVACSLNHLTGGAQLVTQAQLSHVKGGTGRNTRVLFARLGCPISNQSGHRSPRSVNTLSPQVITEGRVCSAVYQRTYAIAAGNFGMAGDTENDSDSDGVRGADAAHAHHDEPPCGAGCPVNTATPQPAPNTSAAHGTATVAVGPAAQGVKARCDKPTVGCGCPAAGPSTRQPCGSPATPTVCPASAADGPTGMFRPEALCLSDAPKAPWTTAMTPGERYGAIMPVTPVPLPPLAAAHQQDGAGCTPENRAGLSLPNKDPPAGPAVAAAAAAQGFPGGPQQAVQTSADGPASAAGEEQPAVDLPPATGLPSAVYASAAVAAAVAACLSNNSTADAAEATTQALNAVFAAMKSEGQEVPEALKMACTVATMSGSLAGARGHSDGAVRASAAAQAVMTSIKAVMAHMPGLL